MEALPTGVRFYPTEQELVGFYLQKKLEHRRPDMERFIPVVDVYNYEPTELPLLSGEASVRDPEQWFFFCPRQPREAQGGRPTRTTRSGYWKATGSPTPVFHNKQIIGIRKTMVFYQGRAPTGRKTAWKMNEYRAAEEASAPSAASSSTTTANLKWRSEFSLCRVYKKSGHLRSFDRRPVVRVARENAGDGDLHGSPPAVGILPSQGNATASAMGERELSRGSSPSDGQDPAIEGDDDCELEELDWDSLVGSDEI